MRLAVFALLLAPALASAAVWPETIGQWKRTATAPAAITADRPLWDEYGLKEAETATYENGDRTFSATVYRLVDSTSALAAFQWQRPAASQDSTLDSLAATTAKGLVAAHGNLLFVFPDFKPEKEEWGALVGGLRNVDTTSLPALIGFLPGQGLVAGSRRYILGPVSLERFAAGIPPAVAAFSLGAEAQMGTFHGAKGDMKLVIFNYPTPQIAIQKIQEFQKIPGAVTKRTGPLVSVIPVPPDPDAAERLIGLIRYEAQITLDERIPTRRDNIGDLVINVFILIGILLSFTLVAGLSFGTFKALRRSLRKGPDPEALITLDLLNRS